MKGQAWSCEKHFRVEANAQSVKLIESATKTSEVPAPLLGRNSDAISFRPERVCKMSCQKEAVDEALGKPTS